jgi:colanic acid/amylovoran biosynthesis glycosyltransferase
MKLAIIVNSFPELSETFIINHIAGEILSGIDVTVFAAHKSESSLRHDIFNKYNIAERTVYLNIPRKIILRLLQGPLIFIKLFLKKPKAAIEALHFKKYQTVAKNMKLLYFGLLFLNKHYEVIHCHFGVNGLIGIYLKECGFCDKIVTTFHGADINYYPQKYGTNVYKTLYKKSDIITANTEFTKSKIIQNGGPDNTVVIPVGLFFDEFAIDKSINKIPHSVITIGRLEEKKGYPYSLEAIAYVKEIIPAVVYYIIGDGTLYHDLFKYAQELNIADNCHFLGFRTNIEVKRYLNLCEVFMLPSITASNGDMEGQGLVLQEAQALGLPVVSTLHNGIPDGVLNGKSGFLVPEKNSKLLAEKIITLLQNKNLRQKMGETGRQFVKEKYDIPAIVKQYNICYEEKYDAG